VLGDSFGEAELGVPLRNEDPDSLPGRKINGESPHAFLHPWEEGVTLFFELQDRAASKERNAFSHEVGCQAAPILEKGIQLRLILGDGVGLWFLTQKILCPKLCFFKNLFLGFAGSYEMTFVLEPFFENVGQPPFFSDSGLRTWNGLILKRSRRMVLSQKCFGPVGGMGGLDS